MPNVSIPISPEADLPKVDFDEVKRRKSQSNAPTDEPTQR
jgi:hypothetical protein